MRIMLQGYLNDANFGDILFAHLFYRRCLNAGFQSVDFWQYKSYGIGSFCRKELGYTTEKSFLACLKADALVLISGGFLWNDANRISDDKLRFRRYILPALLYQFLGKPVYILGAGGGPVDTLWLRRLMVRVLNKAKKVYFRDEATKQVFDDYGVKNTTEVTADTALVLRPEMLDAFEEHDRLEKAALGRKKLLLHIPNGKNGLQYIDELILPELISFLDEHKDYFTVLSCDNIWQMSQAEAQIIEKIKTALHDSHIDFYNYKYHDCWQMCSLINEMDCVVTMKLHVAVVGAVFSKSVISFPTHREKTENFFNMIGQEGRCVNVKNLNRNVVREQLTRFHDQPVHVPEEYRIKAEKNLSALDSIAR